MGTPFSDLLGHDSKTISFWIFRRRSTCRKRPDVGGDVLWPSCASYAPRRWPDAFDIRPKGYSYAEARAFLSLQSRTQVKIVAGVLTEVLMGHAWSNLASPVEHRRCA